MDTVRTCRNTTVDPIHPHIRSLDGLRFIAAGAVLFSHGYFYILLLQDNSGITAYNAPLVALANVGMTLFFVLSGFVIHYNYAALCGAAGRRSCVFCRALCASVSFVSPGGPHLYL